MKKEIDALRAVVRSWEGSLEDYDPTKKDTPEQWAELEEAKAALKMLCENKLFVVTAGEYSDYHIEAICSTRENAEKIVEAIKGAKEDGRIEEWILDEPLDRIAAGQRLFCVRFPDVRKGDGEAGAMPSFEVCGLYGEELLVNVRRFGITDVWAKSAEEALKIGNERRAKWLAEHPEKA